MNYKDAARQCIIDVDVLVARKLWQYVLPHIPTPVTDGEIEIVLHHARSKLATALFRDRAYSHMWLTERGIPSGLPDRLRPRAQRMYPTIVPAVGVSINLSSRWLKPLKPIVQKEIHNAIMDIHADGKLLDDELVKGRILEVRDATMKKFV